ncbi:DUF2235 domain-containing protein [Salinisphaera sp. LB1]|uniref:DUF2235 domain-containing protein n=1 Tax=Salinisphaera sp. LB1 TaxID=2183911 RepID=UPI000D706A1A|nr:DUF2235 domain-containing protein [Salinisphaera sp. LB1]
MPKKLVLCCDGTWDTADQREGGVLTPSNVARIHNAIADHSADGTEQRKYYHSGVGTEEHWWQRVAGGAMGIGLDKHIKEAYQWLGNNYQPEDRIYIFGFSRGAYTARSLVGMIHSVGLLNLSPVTGDKAREDVDRAYSAYRDETNADSQNAEFFAEGAKLPIHFLGVWDTVGALGVPDHMHLLGVLDDPKRYQFFNTRLTPAVKIARHAVAIDERRASFMPTLWEASTLEQHPDARQVWFPGVHCDVGGGYRETGLSDGALDWMIHEAQHAELQFRPGIVEEQDGRKEVIPNAWDVRHDSLTGIFAHLRNQPRNVPHLRSKNAEDIFHESALVRHELPAYH